VKAGAADATAGSGDYVTSSRKLVTLASQAATVFRYYAVLALPVGLALCSILVRAGRMAVRGLNRDATQPRPYDRFVLLLGLWWVLDMAFVWVSPRPYEQYYLPLNASAAMLGGYCIAVYHDKVRSAVYHRGAWVAAGAAGTIAMFILVYPILAGIKIQPTTGMAYPERKRGYVQQLDLTERKKAEGWTFPWEQTADYIGQHSQPSDRIYVWGWIPGIYVRAQRFCPAPVACTSEMHVYPPAVLSKIVSDLVTAFEKRPPRFIVDTHNRHFPYDHPRPPLELWPATQKGLVPADPNTVRQYEAAYAEALDRPEWPDEAARFAAMKPLRDYIMANYRPAQAFSEQVVFERKTPSPAREAQ